MWIKNNNSVTKKMKTPKGEIEFTDKGTAQVTKELGNYAVNNYSAISRMITEEEQEEEITEEEEEIIKEESDN